MGKRGRPPHPDILTPREWEVLGFLREGLSNPEIADRMGIGREGVKYHVSEILSKLGVAGRDEAARWPGPAAGERRPWWTAAFAPLAMLFRRAGASMPGKLAPAALALSAGALVALFAVLGLIAFLLLRGDGGGPGTTELVSVNSTGEPASANSGEFALSADGRTELVSVNSDGEPADAAIDEFALSADGRYVAFTSGATNLAPGDTNEAADVFVHDRETGITEAVSVNSDGEFSRRESSSPAINADGRYVAFCSSSNNLVPGAANDALDVFVRDRRTASTEIVSVSSTGAQADDRSCDPSISAGGRYVAFTSEATNLAPGDTNEASDVFVRDRETGVTERVSVASDGGQVQEFGEWRSVAGVALSADGRFVAFTSTASDLVPGDTNDALDVFVHDRETGGTERVSVSTDGGESAGWSSSPSISGDGRFVTFFSLAGDLAGDVLLGCGGTHASPTKHCPAIFLRDRAKATTERTGFIAPGGSAWVLFGSEPGMSTDGRYVTLMKGGGALAAALVYVDIYDREAGDIERVVTVYEGVQQPQGKHQVAISGDGRYVAFGSLYSELVPADTGDWLQIYVHDRGG